MGIMTIAIIGMIMNKISWQKIVSAMILALILYYIPFVISATNKQVTLLHREPSFYGEIQVVERGEFRCMSIGSSTQSCMKSSTGGNALWYIGLMESLLEPAEGRLLVIGLGGGMIPRDMLEHFDAIDVVDVDPKVQRVAEEFFNYDDSHPSLATYINDGRAFLRHNAKKYNAIALDVFAGSNLAPHLFTQEAFEAMRAALAPGGILVINTTGRPYGEGSELPRSIFKTLNTAFPYLGILSTENIKNNPEKFGNLIFVASDEPKEFPVSGEFVVLYDANDIEDARIFTDAHNPIDAVGAPVYEEAQKFNRALFGIFEIL